MNLFSALAHLAADGVRGVAVLLAGILAVTGVVDAAKADAYCSLFVCVFVLLAAGSLLRVLIRSSAPQVYEEFEDLNCDNGIAGKANRKSPASSLQSKRSGATESKEKQP